MSKKIDLSKTVDTTDLQPMTRLLGIVGLAVCVPVGWTDEQVEEFANRDSPTGISSKWEIKRQAEYNKELKERKLPSRAEAASERTPCLDRADFIHLILQC